MRRKPSRQNVYRSGMSFVPECHDSESRATITKSAAYLLFAQWLTRSVNRSVAIAQTTTQSGLTQRLKPLLLSQWRVIRQRNLA